ncbi:phage major capsid protein [Noviherbaspirillum saxi]|uniref:Phage major capsid protein n=1 Tax=Noviherbaspirillum saxi TaxID=2320863 RepID=A0A3A3FXU2_9BURK|nr:phage major capsid protein [Noviherbaspirillum saxi]RJF99021.1 phage major capsid protein [Noviherbaspirillum saxi]
MATINELRSERAKINNAVQTLAKIEADGGQLTAEQTTQFTDLQAQFADLTAQIDRAMAAERLAAMAAVPVDKTGTEANQPNAPPAASMPATPRIPEVPGAKVSRMVRALAAAQGNPEMAAKIAIDRGFGEDVAMSLNTLTSGAGGVLVPTNLSSEVIELMRPKAVVRRLGARALPLNNGNVSMPRLKGGAVVGYIGSDSDVPATQQQFDDLKLSAKKLSALVPISNDLLSYSGANPNVDRIVVSDLTGALAAREDKAFIRDDGTGNTPKGLLFWALAGNKIAASDGATIPKVETDLNKLILALEGVDANMTEPGWMMSPRTFRFLEGLRDGNGNKVYPEMANKMLKGYPVGVTTQIPNNLGAGTNASEIYFVDFGDCFIGEDEELMIDYSKEATYKDGEGNVISAFQRDQTLIRVISKHDFGPRHVESVAILTGVAWGA